MAQNPIAKRQAIAATAVAAASQVLQGINILAECAAGQTAMGGDGNFQDSDFATTNNPYLSGYNAGVLVASVGPNLAAALAAFVSGSSGPTNAQMIRLCVPTPPT